MSETARVIAPPPLIYLGALGCGFALQAVLPALSIWAGVRWGVGGVLLVGGVILARGFFRAFKRARTPVSPYEETRALVTTGPYRLSRNPAYVGLALIYMGTALLAGAIWPLATLLPALAIVDRGVIAREEHYLEAKFGEEYRAYKGRVRRWL